MRKMRKNSEISDAENRALLRAAKSDLDNPPLTLRQLRKLRPAREVVPGLVAAAKRGRPRVDNPKVSVSFRTDKEVQTLIIDNPELKRRAIAAFERVVRKSA